MYTDDVLYTIVDDYLLRMLAKLERTNILSSEFVSVVNTFKSITMLK